VSVVPTLLVATPGGHLQELYELLPRLSVADPDDLTWVTSDGPQVASLLRGSRVVLVPYAHPRDLAVAVRHLLLARRVLGARRYTDVVSTGSSVAVPFLALAAAHGIPAHFIESATRVEEPSLAGRLLQHVPGVHLYRQAEPGWRDPRWHYRGSVYDCYRPDAAEASPVRRVAVATGSSESYGFRRLLEAVAAVLPDDVAVSWQTGSTLVEGLAIAARPAVPSDRLAAEFAAADAVVIHAGVGLSLLALAAGKCPVVVPRRAARGEHIDDHQVAVAAMLARRGLAVHCEAPELTMDVIRTAAGRAVRHDGVPPPFCLNREPAHRRGSRGTRKIAPRLPRPASRSAGRPGRRPTRASRGAGTGRSSQAPGAAS
jgi:UDP-N-acetylglucosamine--N-acetylmuramyl-(pentapeptide) pyrophosphoryl-undecaprenol N-acetylglucosamine transferase